MKLINNEILHDSGAMQFPVKIKQSNINAAFSHNKILESEFLGITSRKYVFNSPLPVLVSSMCTGSIKEMKNIN